MFSDVWIRFLLIKKFGFRLARLAVRVLVARAATGGAVEGGAEPARRGRRVELQPRIVLEAVVRLVRDDRGRDLLRARGRLRGRGRGTGRGRARGRARATARATARVTVALMARKST